MPQDLLDSSHVIPIDHAESYADDGFLLLRGVLDDDFFAPLEGAFLELVSLYAGRRFSTMHDAGLRDLLDGNRAEEASRRPQPDYHGDTREIQDGRMKAEG